MTTLITIYRLIIFAFVLFQLQDLASAFFFLRDPLGPNLPQTIYYLSNFSFIIGAVILWFMPLTILGLLDEHYQATQQQTLNPAVRHLTGIEPHHLIFVVGLCFLLLNMRPLFFSVANLIINDMNTQKNYELMQLGFTTFILILSVSIMWHCKKISRFFTL